MERNKIRNVEGRIMALEKDLETLLSIGRLFENQEIEKKDQLWQCEKCGARLGIYDPVTDELRVRHKDFYAYLKAGSGGYIRLVCRSCSHINELCHDDENN